MTQFNFDGFKGNSKKWWIYFLIGTIGSFSVAMFFKDELNPVVKVIGVFLWFCMLMISATGTKKEEEKKDAA